MPSVIAINVKFTTPISTGHLAMMEFNNLGYQLVTFHSGDSLIGITIAGVDSSAYYDRRMKRGYGRFNEILKAAEEFNPNIRKELGL